MHFSKEGYRFMSDLHSADAEEVDSLLTPMKLPERRRFGDALRHLQEPEPEPEQEASVTLGNKLYAVGGYDDSGR